MPEDQSRARKFIALCGAACWLIFVFLLFYAANMFPLMILFMLGLLLLCAARWAPNHWVLRLETMLTGWP